MSGIYGMWQPYTECKHLKTDSEKLRIWNKAYGNSTEEVYEGQDICLGCFLETFSQVSGNGVPIIKENGKYAVIDAVLYNRREMCEKARIEVACSDEELLFRYIERFGMDGLGEINGDFCGAIYDPSNKKVVLFRDHMGVRPLFYYADEKSVVFSTDMRGLLATEQVNTDIDEQWLWGKLVGAAFMGTENTEFAHICCVKPASYITFSVNDKGIHLEKKSYWKLGSKKIRFLSEKTYINRMRELITDSIKRRLDAVSGSIGAELSGGLDSGVIDILIHRLGRECTYFSWSASPEDIPYAEQDERLVIKDICEQEGIDCNYGGRTLLFNNESILTETMKQLGLDVAINEGPYRMYVLPPYVNTLQIAETSQFMKRSGVDVIFTGHGGDEGVSHRCNAYELFYHKEYLSYFRHFWLSTEGKRFRIGRTLKRCYKNVIEGRTHLEDSYEDVHIAKGIIKKEFYEKCTRIKRPPLTFAYDAKEYINDGGSRNRLDVVALLGAYSGVRYMVPYLDYRVIDYAVSIPRRMYLKNQKNRYIFKEAFKDIMPSSLYTLTGKKDNSWSNMEKKEQKESDYMYQKEWYVSLLDKEYWKEYFDWDELERWVKQERKEENTWLDKGIFRSISLCVLVQNLLVRSKEVCEPK